MTDQSARLRTIEKQVTEISAEVKHINKRSETTALFIEEIRDGKRALPQCREREKELAIIQEQLKAQKGFKNSLTLSAIGGAVALFVKHMWDKLIH